MTVADRPLDFLRQRVRDDVAAGRNDGRVVTRFPPEPNGYLHIGHAKAICLDFGIASEFGGRCHLRMDDTNPEKEDPEFEAGIQADVHWLGFEWGEHLYFASDYYEQLYAFAEQLVRAGKAYVDSRSAEEIRATRGTLTEPGTPSPHRDRSVEENLDLFRRMRAGEFEDGACVLRAKIDMAAPNVTMRDPALYRIRRRHHHRTGDAWCIYPMYDFAHCLSDAIEGITHSFCTLEFEDHRPLYDWILEQVDAGCRPQQIEFGRLNLSYTITSKRKLKALVDEGHVRGWDDPRMPTLVGLRRRGCPPEAIRMMCEKAGVTKRETITDVALLEHAMRDVLNRTAPRAMAVLRPLRVIVETWPEGETDMLDAVNHPDDPGQGTRPVPFTRELWIERDDFMEDPPRKFHRLAPGREVRLRWAYFLTCTGVDRDPATGEIVAIRCTHDPATRGGDAPDGRKVKGTIHWVSATHGVPAEVRLYDRLFDRPDPGAADDFRAHLNPASLEVLTDAVLEPSLADLAPETPVQFERLGYFVLDPDATRERLVFNRTVTLRDAWAKLAGGGA